MGSLPGSDRLYLERELQKISKTLSDIIAAIPQVEQISGGATTSNPPQGQAILVKDTSGGSVKLVYNDSGTLKSVTLV
jgi:YD repeat-containing protein